MKKRKISIIRKKLLEKADLRNIRGGKSSAVTAPMFDWD